MNEGHVFKSQQGGSQIRRHPGHPQPAAEKIEKYKCGGAENNGEKPPAPGIITEDMDAGAYKELG